MSSLDYYEREVDAFFSRTVDLDLTPIWDAFLEHVTDGGLILDAGCGSGRDSRQFLQRGYRVSAFDASAAMAEKASAYTGIPVERRRIEDLTEVGIYDGVWCCAAALHVADSEIVDALRRLHNALCVGGTCYLSFKVGPGERIEDGRRFLDFDEARLTTALNRTNVAEVVRMWRTDDQGSREKVTWLNSLSRRL